MTKGDLDALAKEGASVAEKRKWLAREDETLKSRIVQEAKSESRLLFSSLVPVSLSFETAY